MNLSWSPRFLVAAALALATALPAQVCRAEALHVVAVHNAPQEVALKARLESVVEKYKLGKWLYTGEIRVDQDVWPPHSHPVLTLGVRDAQLSDDVYLAGAVLHEEFHWNMVLNSKDMPDQLAALVKTKFPALDPKAPKGSGDEESTYGHVLVCYMEYKALASVFGDGAARKSLTALPFYTGIYALVTDRNNQAALEDLLRQEEVRY